MGTRIRQLRLLRLAAILLWLLYIARDERSSLEWFLDLQQKENRDAAEWLFGGGEMGNLIRAFDWSGTTLGPLASWPQSLRLAVGLCLNSRFPMHIWWGPELIYLYNDAHISMLGKRHPSALGRPAPEVWPEVWPLLAPQVEAVMLRGESTWNEQVHVVVERNGFPEDGWFTWSYSPIRDESGAIVGLYDASVEDTPRVLAERDRDRLAALRERQRADEHARTILESITDAFFAVDREWRFTYVNPQAERVLGRRSADLMGKVIWDEYPGLNGSAFEAAYRRAADERVAESVTDLLFGSRPVVRGPRLSRSRGNFGLLPRREREQECPSCFGRERSEVSSTRRRHAADRLGSPAGWDAQLLQPPLVRVHRPESRRRR